MNHISKLILMILVGAGLMSSGYLLGVRRAPTSFQVIQKEETNPTPTVIEQPKQPRILTYQNRDLGFQFEYPETSAIDSGNPIQLYSLAGRGDFGGAVTIAVFSPLKKVSVDTQLKVLLSEHSAAQKARSEACKEDPGPEGADFCATYGGGNEFSKITFLGVDAVKSEFHGEGDAASTIYLPTKGFSISFDGSYELPEVIKNFTFIDRDRVISDHISGIEYTCPASWTCNPSHDRSYTGSTINYHVASPKNVRLEILLYKASPEETRVALERRRTHPNEGEPIVGEFTLTLNGQEATVVRSATDADVFLERGGLIRFWSYAESPNKPFLSMFLK